MNEYPTISIIIPTHPEQTTLDDCLNSIRLLEPEPFEVLIVYDGALNESFAYDNDEFQILQMGIRKGPAAARNLGVSKAKGDVIVFIDSDIMAPTNLINVVSREFASDQNLDALFGSYDVNPVHPSFLSQYRNLLHHFVHQKGEEEAYTFWTGCGAIKRDVFLNIGGFDSSKFSKPSIEDIELGYRLKKNGYKIKLLKSLQVTHLKKWTPLNLISVDFYSRAVPWTKMIWTHKILRNDLNTSKQDRWSVILVFMMMLSMLLMVWYQKLVVVFTVLFLVFIFFNRKLYIFFAKQRNILFSIRTLPWHFIFYAISGMGFIVGSMQYLIFDRYRSVNANR